MRCKPWRMQGEPELPEPQMRRYEVISDKAVEIIEAEDYDHSVAAASYVFTAAGRKVYEVARHRVASIGDLGPAETKEEECTTETRCSLRWSPTGE